jgi:nucleoside-diphosphate-sugar epimerase
MDFVKILAEELIRSGVLPADFDLTKHYELVPMQPGDVKVTYADVDPLEKAFGFKPQVTLQEGLHEFSEWYARYENGITG